MMHSCGLASCICQQWSGGKQRTCNLAHLEGYLKMSGGQLCEKDEKLHAKVNSKTAS